MQRKTTLIHFIRKGICELNLFRAEESRHYYMNYQNYAKLVIQI